MRRLAFRSVLVIALVGLGWSLGRAQAAQADFEIVVTSPAGQTTVECRRGCELVWSERGINPNARPQDHFTFSCSGPSVQSCSSGAIAGWVRR